MLSVRVPNFKPSRHGFPFPNRFPSGSPVVEIPTPFGRIKIGDASAGLCGGMVFAAMDLYSHGEAAVPECAGPPVVRYLCRRLLDSWNLPFGVLKYYDWQRRPAATKFLAGIRVCDGLMRLTVLEEWPEIRARLGAGRPVALGIVNSAGYGSKALIRNHQVLCYGYDFDEASQEVTLAIYDPNHPGDDTATLTFRVDEPDADGRIVHSCEGATVRGLFLTENRRPADPPPI